MSLFSYDTVTLIPQGSSLESRANADTSVQFLGYSFKLPVIPANMIDVISFSNAQLLDKEGYAYIMHRFNGATPEFIRFATENSFRVVSVSVGTRNYEKDLEPAKQGLRADIITIDVAHGHHEMMKRTVGWIREHVPNAKIIAGNVATGDGVEFLANLGVDAVKVGIGGGGICTTRYKTGFHLPTLHSVYVANQFLHVNNLYDIPIIADGGAKHYGDISKALTFGAAMVMSGGWFASCIDSPAKIENGKKIYRGSTSFAAKGENRHVEGKTLELDSGVTYLEKLVEIQQSLQSAISYAGGNDLHAFDFVNYERIDPRH